MFKSFNYVDYCLIFFGALFSIKIFNWIRDHKPPIYQQSPFLVDKPIELSQDDKFGRKIFATKIAEKIQSKLLVDKAGALAIGINGPWGSGKSSFTNMVKENIDNINRIVIDFNPWRSSSSTRIIEDFFELLVTEIKPYDPSLSNNLAEYAKTLTKIDENILTKSAEALTDFISEDKSKNEVYRSINFSIEKIKKQIIIFIDDLDRLDKKEIIEVLRIIRNTANFHNIVYIVSYDKGYIQSAIKDFNEYNYKSFLEKIFQFEFTLPLYENGVLRTEIKRLLKGKLEEKFHIYIDQAVDSNSFYGINFTNEFIKTYRDVIRFCNSLLFEIETIKEEVFFHDFYLLQLLKLEYPKVYDVLIDYRYIFFAKDNEKGIYRLKNETEAWATEDSLLYSRLFDNNKNVEVQNSEKSNFEKYLIDSRDHLSLSEYDVQLLQYLVKALLTLKDSNNTNKQGLYKSFAYPENFHKYFAFRLYDGDLSSFEFELYRRSNYSVYVQKVNEWIQEGKYSILSDRLGKVKEFSSPEEFENHVRILFEIGHRQVKENNPYYMDYESTLQVLQYPLNNPIFKSYLSDGKYLAFIKELFGSAPTPATYESSIIARIIARDISFIIENQQLEQINLDYFKEYLKCTDNLTIDFWQLYNNCVSKNTNGDKKTPKMQEAMDLAKREYKKRIKACDLGRFIQQANPDSEYYNLKEDEWTFAFDNLEQFENWLNTESNIDRESDCFMEFVDFY
jgi:hypothetical protein